MDSVGQKGAEKEDKVIRRMEEGPISALLRIYHFEEGAIKAALEAADIGGFERVGFLLHERGPTTACLQHEKRHVWLQLKI